MNPMKPLTYDQQIAHLQSCGLRIEDYDLAKDVLDEIGFYRFCEYGLQYEKPSTDIYKDGTTFNGIYHLYLTDEMMRDLLRRYLEKVEVYYRNKIAYGFSMIKCVSAPYDQHYDSQNFYNKKGHREVMTSFMREKRYFKEGQNDEYPEIMDKNRIPLDVIVDLLSFSNLSKLYNSMYDSEKNAIASAVGISKDTLQNHLHCLSVLRNKCAHGGRLYNMEFNPPARFTTAFLKKHPQVQNNSLFAYVMILVKRLPYREDREKLVRGIYGVLQVYAKDVDLKMIGFPKDYMEILENLL